jgi:carboxyl-terminal processing protease
MQMQQMRIASTDDAVTALQAAMQMASQQFQISPVVVGLEFEYGAIESLDRFSAFVPPETARVTNQQLGEAVVGIGVQIELAEQGVRITKVLPDGPAAQSGLHAGDLIMSVDGEPIPGRDLEVATSRITGQEGSTVTLGLLRDGRQSQVALPRRSVALHSVTDVQMIDPADRIGYMKLETFASNSAQEMQQALWTLHQQGMQSLILDLRGDPGGLLTAAVQTADLFLPDGTIVSTRGRNESDNTTETAKAPETWKVPLVVLVDENSASASEIFAAAIQENGRGTIVGRHTYGKGTVQTLFPLQSVSAGLRLTTAKFYSPMGREMAGAGVEPDVLVEERGQSSGRASTADDAVQTAIQVARNGATGSPDFAQRNGMSNLLRGRLRNVNR